MPAKKTTHRTRKVALLIQTASHWSRQVIRGIANYAHQQRGWDFYIEPWGIHETPSLPKNWHGDGVIARVIDSQIERALKRLGLPAVNVSWLGNHSQAIPQVVSDEARCAQLAASHFLEKQFVNFGYVGPFNRGNYADRMGDEFQRIIQQSQGRCDRFKLEAGAARMELHQQRAELMRWLAGLSKPVGLLVWSSETGREVTAACTASGLSIPAQVAVLCAEHDPMMSALAPIPLSNLDQAPVQVGFTAASLLDRLMRGRSAPRKPTLVPPVGVVQRLSTDTAAVDDPLVKQALEFIRSGCRQPLQVIDLQKEFSVSRRMLEHRFLRSLGCTPAAEIRRQKLEQVKRLLIESDLTLAQIADQTGFSHVEVMVRCFQREIGVSPTQFRRPFRGH